MKKLSLTLFSIFFFANVYAQETLSYEIDEEATAKAPWRVGERVVTDEVCLWDVKKGCYIEFLGVTNTGDFLMQQFYKNGDRSFAPFFLIFEDELIIPVSYQKGHSSGAVIYWHDNWQKAREYYLTDDQIDGHYRVWFRSGKKQTEATFANGKPEGLVQQWYESGGKDIEGHYKNGLQIGVWRQWDEDGHLISETDYGTPED